MARGQRVRWPRAGGLGLGRGFQVPSLSVPWGLGPSPRRSQPVLPGWGAAGRLPASREEGRREESRGACRARARRAPGAGPLGSGFGRSGSNPASRFSPVPALLAPACLRPPRRPPPPPECRPLGQVCRASPRTPASQSAAELKRAQPCGRGQSEPSRVELAGRTSAGQPEPRAASARRRPSRPPRPPRRLPPSPPSPRPCPASGQPAPVAAPAEPGGHRPAPPLPWAAHRLHALLLLPGLGAWHRGPLPDARGPAPLFAPRLLLLLLLSSSSSNSPRPQTPLASPRVRARPPLSVPSRRWERVRPGRHHGTVRLARAALHPGRAQRRAAGCRAQVEKLLGSATSLRVQRLRQERCPHARDQR